jgi:hypothetical protein
MDKPKVSESGHEALHAQGLEEVRDSQLAASRWENTIVFLICAGLSIYGLLAHKPLTIVFVVLAMITALWAGKHWRSWSKLQTKRGRPPGDKPQAQHDSLSGQWPIDVSANARHLAAGIKETIESPESARPIKSNPGLKHLLCQHRALRTRGRLMDCIGLVAFALAFMIFYSSSVRAVPVAVIVQFGVLLMGWAGCFYFFPEKKLKVSGVHKIGVARFRMDMMWIDLGPLIGPLLLFVAFLLWMVWSHQKWTQMQLIVLIVCVISGAIVFPWIAASVWKRRYAKPGPQPPGFFMWSTLGFWSACVFIVVNLLVGLVQRMGWF